MVKLNRFVAQTRAIAKEVNDNTEILLNNAGQSLINQLKDRTVTRSNDGVSPFAEAYVNATGRNNSVVTAETSAVFDTNKYKAYDVKEEIETLYGSDVYILIEAESISNVSHFAINNCTITPLGQGKWVLGCTTGTAEVRRAQIYKTLFYGTNGTNPRASSTYLTNCSGIKTKVSRDIDKRGFYAHSRVVWSSHDGGSGRVEIDLDITFSNTSTNLDYSIWSFASGSNFTASSPSVNVQHQKIETPKGTTILQRTSPGSTDHTGTDRTVDEFDNPPTLYLSAMYQQSNWVNTNNSLSSNARCYFLANSNISSQETIVTNTNSGTQKVLETVVIDFKDDFGVPEFELLQDSDLLFDFEITHTIPAGTFSDTVSSGYAVVDIADWEDGASLTWEAYNGSDSTGELPFNIIGNKAYCKISQFTEFLAQAENYKINLIPKETDPTAGVPSIRGSLIQLL